MRARLLALPLPLVLTAAAAVAATTPAVAHAAAPTVRASGPTQTVTLELTPRNRAALKALTTTKGLTQTERFARSEAALPGTARAAEVAATMTALGFHVVRSDEFSVAATAPASVVLADFGSSRAQAPSLPTAQALPHLPASLAGLVTVATGGDETRPALLPRSVSSATTIGPRAERASSAVAPTDGSLSIAQARGTYRVPYANPTAVPSSTAPIIASMQFPTSLVQSPAGRSQTLTDLTTFASNNKIYSTTWNATSSVATVPVAPSQSGCSDPTKYDPNNTSDEVALDQETLLSVAPQLRQRIYYAANDVSCSAAQDDVLQAIYTDVHTNHLPIVAVSTSWGSCEASSAGQLTADQDQVDALLGVGVTVFAASGDLGAFDCVSSSGSAIANDAVDDPGSVPGVISVGGTGGTSSTTLAAWNSAGFSTGGGFSCRSSAIPGFDQSSDDASYQSGVREAPRYPTNGYACSTSGSSRQVPDIATDGADGLDTVVTEYGSTGVANSSPSTYQIYGTSFSAPLAAAGYAQTLSNSNKTGTDVLNKGGLSGLLYSGYSPASAAFADVIRGSNGDYAATPGWDPTTGLGAPHWPVVLATVTGAAVPTQSAPVTTLKAGSPGLVSANGTSSATLGGDGNFVVRDNYTGLGTVVLNTASSGHTGAVLAVQGDGNIVLRATAGGTALWASGTVGSGITQIAALNNGTFAGLSAGGVVIWTPAGRTGATASSVPAGALLTGGQSLISPNGTYSAQMQTDGNLVVRNGGSATYATATGAKSGAYATVGSDGNLLVTYAGVPVFSAGATGNPHDTLGIGNDGVLVLTTASGLVVWRGANPGGVANGPGTLTGLTSGSYPYNHTLTAGQAIWASNASYVLTMQTDGNLVERNAANAVTYQSYSGGHPGGYAVFQGDGNLVARASSGAATFSTGTANLGATVMIMQTDGNIVMRTAAGKAVWTSKGGRV